MISHPDKNIETFNLFAILLKILSMAPATCARHPDLAADYLSTSSCTKLPFPFPWTLCKASQVQLIVCETIKQILFNFFAQSSTGQCVNMEKDNFTNGRHQAASISVAYQLLPCTQFEPARFTQLCLYCLYILFAMFRILHISLAVLNSLDYSSAL